MTIAILKCVAHLWLFMFTEIEFYEAACPNQERRRLNKRHSNDKYKHCAQCFMFSLTPVCARSQSARQISHTNEQNYPFQELARKAMKKKENGIYSHRKIAKSIG